MQGQAHARGDFGKFPERQTGVSETWVVSEISTVVESVQP